MDLITPMLRLVRSGKTSLVQLLLDHDNFYKDLLFPDPLEYKLLSSAIAGGPDMMELLLKGGHLILPLDKEDRESTMELVARRRQLASFKFLTDRGFHFSTQCAPSAFDYIARAACESEPPGTGDANDMFDVLLSYGVDINIRDHYGATALWKVCERDNSFHCVEYLLKKGADSFIPNENGEIPFFYTQSFEHTWLMLQHVNIRDMSRDDVRREIDEFVTDAIELEG